jgi:deoxyribose-phosphate aldolase
MEHTGSKNGIATLSPSELAQYIDHTLLRPEATEAEIDKLCAEAVEFSFKAVCVERRWITRAKELVRGSSVLVATVLSFPLGLDSTVEKHRQAVESLDLGADEMDMVLHRGWLKDKKYREVMLDIRGVVEAACGAPVKVILETSELSREEKIVACGLAKAAGAGFVKTSTGFSKSGATVEDVKLMREVVGRDMGVKASGGVRSYQDALAMIAAGATRLGTSAGVALVKGARGEGNY